MSVQLCLHAHVIPARCARKVRALAEVAARTLVAITDASAGRRVTWEEYEEAKAACVRALDELGRELPVLRLPHAVDCFVEVCGAIDKRRGRELRTSCMTGRAQAALAAGLTDLEGPHGASLFENAQRPITARRLRAWLRRALVRADGQALALHFRDGVWSESPDPRPSWDNDW